MPIWRKSTASNPSGNCVEFAVLGPDEIGVRNSRDPDGPMLTFTRAEIDAWLAGTAAGEFDGYGQGTPRRHYLWMHGAEHPIGTLIRTPDGKVYFSEIKTDADREDES